MRAFVVDAFTTAIFGGNQAGVVLLDQGAPFPEEGLMQAVAGELKHSETAYVRPLGGNRFHIRYFTPAGEVDLCGHATIASFSLLRQLGQIGEGTFTLLTAAGEQEVRVEGEAVYLTISPVSVVRELTPEQGAELLAAYGLRPEQGWPGLAPALVNSGLTDIMLPVRDHSVLMAAVQDEGAVTDLSRRYDVVGVHMFCPNTPDAAAHCRNFAPLYAIPEEAATGTSNGALTYYLFRRGLVAAGADNRFVQGEKMGKPSEILSRLTETEGGVKVQVGGRAVLTLRCELL